MRNKIHNRQGVPNVVMLPVNERVLLRQKELARALGVSARSIDNLRARKAIPTIKISSRMVRFDLVAVLTALRRYEIREVGRGT